MTLEEKKQRLGDIMLKINGNLMYLYNSRNLGMKYEGQGVFDNAAVQDMLALYEEAKNIRGW